MDHPSSLTTREKTNALKLNNQYIIGTNLINLFNLKMDKDGLIHTSWGKKTPVGLFLSVKNILEDPNIII